MTTANYVTLARILFLPALLVFLLTRMPDRVHLNTIIYVIAALTDSIDGYLARKLKQVTDLGKFLDPLADKLFISAILIVLVNRGDVAIWAAAVIIGREVIIAGFRFYCMFRKGSFSASWMAKVKTGIQLVGLGFFILYRGLAYPQSYFKLATVLLYISIFFSIFSGVEYIIKFSRHTRSA